MYPTALFDQRTKSVVLHFSAWPASHGYYSPQPHQIVSTNSGRTFSAPRPVLPHVHGVALFVGSCRGSVITAGPNAGRLLMAGYNHSLNKKGPRTSQTYVWYSDDSAASWQLAGRMCAQKTCAAVPIPHMSEPQIIGDSDSVALFSRSNAEMGCKCQNSARSTSGGETWSRAANCTGLPSPNCQGSVLMTGSSSGLYSGPASMTARANMSVFATEDAGEHWRPLVEVGAPSTSGMYSCLENLAGLEHTGSASKQAEEAVGLLWETSEQHGGKVNCVGPGCAIVFSRIKHDDIPRAVGNRSTQRTLEAAGISRVSAKMDDSSTAWNPLAGLPPLRVTHHSWPICRDGLQSGVQCQLPIESNNPVLIDYVRITGAMPLSVAYGCQWEAKQPWPLNATEIFEIVKICHLAGAAARATGTGITPPGISLNYSPWAAFWNPHCKDHCDPTNSTGEAEELSFYQGRLEEIKRLVDEANQLLATTTNASANATAEERKGKPPPVRVSALLLDSEKLQGWGASGRDNITIKAAITRKHDLMYNASKAVFPDAIVEQYDKGTIEDEKSMSTKGTSKAWAPWSVYTLEEQGDSFATSLYSVPEIGQTRQQFRLTVQNAVEHNVSSVTPWIALGSGYRRGITNTSLGSNYWDSAWDYGYEYSWILGAEINQPFYAKNPVKFAPWNFAKRVCFYPSVFEQVMTVPVATPHGNSTLIFLHFLAYVRGAAGVPELPQWRPVPPQFDGGQGARAAGQGRPDEATGGEALAKGGRSGEEGAPAMTLRPPGR